jgi:ssDNA thymidine ADP-ribosyltransferase, DarT
MDQPPNKIPIDHITDVENLPQILTGGGLCSDAAMAQRNPEVIGYAHIKQRRLTFLLQFDCCTC